MVVCVSGAPPDCPLGFIGAIMLPLWGGVWSSFWARSLELWTLCFPFPSGAGERCRNGL